MNWEAVIGLEIHTQLATASKIFSGSSTRYGAVPNSQASLVDLGYPGVLPVLNASVVHMAIKFGLATGCTIARRSVFARKNYFYPDLPKGYQISQYELPIVHGGHLEIVTEKGDVKTIGITRAHLEEDAGKSLHEDFHGLSGIDLNRAGTPLLEIVSEPDLRSAREAGSYMRAIHTLVRYLGISDGNMQEGSFRCDANVSVRPRGQAKLGTRTEIKNVNSFRFVERPSKWRSTGRSTCWKTAAGSSRKRGFTTPPETRPAPCAARRRPAITGISRIPTCCPWSLRRNWSSGCAPSCPSCPRPSGGGLPIGTVSRRTIPAFSPSRSRRPTTSKPRCARPAPHREAISNWFQGEFTALLNRHGGEVAAAKIGAETFAALVDRVADGTLSGSLGKEVLEALWDGEGTVDGIIQARGLKQISDEGAIEALVDDVIAAFPEQVGQYRSGKGKVIGFLVGQVMKASRGKANPRQVNEVLRKRLAG